MKTWNSNVKPFGKCRLGDQGGITVHPFGSKHFTVSVNHPGVGVGGSLVVRTRRLHCWGPGSVPGQGTETLQAHCDQKKHPGDL